MSLMKKIFLVLSLAVFFAPAALGMDDGGDAAPIIFTATVTLRDMEREGGFTILKLGLPDGGEAEARVAEHSFFFDSSGSGLSLQDFVRRYRGGTVTIDFMDFGDWFLIEECRAGNR